MLNEVFEWEQRLANPTFPSRDLSRLRARLEQWSRAATETTASPERNKARRLLSAVSAGVSARTNDDIYLKMIEQYWRAIRPRL